MKLFYFCVCLHISVAVTRPVCIHRLHVSILLQFTLSEACHSRYNHSELPKPVFPIQYTLGSVQVLLQLTSYITMDNSHSA